ncbi:MULTISPECIES: low temperature requirement protein A [unclassified Streptomyces]|uniref:low temperature requirement protein A n=1 Tax=unclassified Streptomyces TaxID=2593676 RepID=UPI00081D656C|nr:MULTISPECIES: low temperature requirement protein A [unclassified Streptomyces]MYR26511.1 low temperature requirement protein A [Streptomyces sp. SID4945]SCF04861.1 Low temperature requirement protein LtrA [Streptomyces sp. LcepLS]
MSPRHVVPGFSWHRPMAPREPAEEHRTATVLELFFDLCFVTAVAQAAAALEHEVTAGHTGHGVLGYALVFFAIWWAWMGFTWFASAYDTDDVPYRLLTLVQIAGALAVAAGARDALEHLDFTVITWGYVVMRLAGVAQWLRAAAGDPERRTTCLRYAAGILVVQLGWLGRLALPDDAGLWSFLVLAAAELAVPAWAERHAATTWHPHHIAERYGLFTLIVLGESITAAVATLRGLLDEHALGDLLPVGVGGLLTVFSLWWLYFLRTEPKRLGSLAAALRWGYGHYAVFASAAAVGAGFALAAEHAGHGEHSEAPDLTTAAVFTVPVAVYVLVVRLLQREPEPPGLLDGLWGAGVLAVLAVTFAPSPVLATGLVLAALVVAVVAVTHRRARAAAVRGGA